MCVCVSLFVCFVCGSQNEPTPRRYVGQLGPTPVRPSTLIFDCRPPPNKVRDATDNRLFRENLTNWGLFFFYIFWSSRYLRTISCYRPSYLYISTSPVGLAIIIIIIIITFSLFLSLSALPDIFHLVAVVISFLAGAVGTRTQPGGRRRAATQRTNERTNRSHSWRQVVELCTHTVGRREKWEKRKKCFGYVFSRLLPIPWLGMMAAIIAGRKRGRSSLGAAQSCTISSQPTHRSPPASSPYINLLSRVLSLIHI